MTTYHPDREPLGLAPVYEQPEWQTPRALRLFGYALAVLVVLIMVTLALDRLGAPRPFSMTCWESGDHNGAVVCTMQPPSGASVQDG